MFRDRLLASKVGADVVVPVGGETVSGRLAAVYRDWIVLEDASSDGETVDGILVVALPIAWIQVVA